MYSQKIFNLPLDKRGELCMMQFGCQYARSISVIYGELEYWDCHGYFSLCGHCKYASYVNRSL